MLVSYLINHFIFLICLNLLQHVDEENSYLCGYLKITGLTFEYPMLTTFFDGEIISKKYPFLTRKWDADEDVDRKHWVCIANFVFICYTKANKSLSLCLILSKTYCFQSKFSAFKNKYEKTFNSDNFDYDGLAESDYVFMRWKEHFLVSHKLLCFHYKYICTRNTNALFGRQAGIISQKLFCRYLIIPLKI